MSDCGILVISCIVKALYPISLRKAHNLLPKKGVMYSNILLTSTSKAIKNIWLLPFTWIGSQQRATMYDVWGLKLIFPCGWDSPSCLDRVSHRGFTNLCWDMHAHRLPGAQRQWSFFRTWKKTDWVNTFPQSVSNVLCQRSCEYPAYLRRIRD